MIDNPTKMFSRLHRGKHLAPESHTHTVSGSHVTYHVTLSLCRAADESTSISSESCDEEFLSLKTAQDQPSTSSPHSQPKSIQEKVRRRGGAEKTQSGKRGAGQVAQWDRNGRRRRRRKESEGEEKERGRRGKSVVVAVREGGRGGEIEKVSSIRQDQEVKTQLSLDTQKRQETIHHNNQLKVSNKTISQFHFQKYLI